MGRNLMTTGSQCGFGSPVGVLMELTANESSARERYACKRDKIFGPGDVCFCSIILTSCTLVVVEAAVFPVFVYLMVVKQPFPD